MLHDQERRARVLADVVQRADVGMGELRDGARFAVEALAELRVRGQRVGQHLDRDGSRPSRVSRARYTSPMPPAPNGATIS